MTSPVELDWLLAWAFADGAAAAPAASEVDAAKLLELGERTGLLARVSRRVTRETRSRVLGLEASRAIDRFSYSATALCLCHEKVVQALAALAQESPTPVLVLKGLALHLGEHTAPGSRVIADIDVLVPPESAQKLFDLLLREGCQPFGFRPTEQHLPVVRHPWGSPIEIHHHLGGVRLTGGRWATASEVIDAGLVISRGGGPEGIWLPSRELLVAHLIAHSLWSHGEEPEAYPALQLIADLQDLGYSPAGGRRIPSGVHDWLAIEVHREDTDAALELLTELEKGVPARQVVATDSPAGLLLRHMLAGSLDEDYRRALKLRRQFHPTGGDRGSNWIRNSWSALWLTRSQIDVIFGRPRSRWGYLGWRLWRPIDLVGRAVRSAAAWVRLGSRRQGRGLTGPEERAVSRDPRANH